MKVFEKDSIRKWDSYYKNIKKSRNIDYNESEADKRKRIATLELNFFDWAKYYFPNICKAEFAKWHKQYTKYVIENDQCYAAIMVSRDMAKSSVSMLLVMYLYYRGEFKSLGYFSHIQTQAEMLLAGIKVAFEKNEALMRDYGNQIGTTWTTNKFITSKGVSFRAVGAGQNPRGEKNEDADRFDFQIFDDFDDPEVCRNPERLDNHWKYVLGDCFPAMHVSGKRRIIFLNNKIDEDCIIHRATEHGKAIKNALLVKVNLVDKNGMSNWPEAFTNEQCKEMLALVGDEAETEYMNNPSKRGTQFKKDWFVFKKMPPLNQYKALVAYLDGGFKKTKTSDTKALILLGMHNGEIHIRKVYVDNVSIETMISWHYDLYEILKHKNATGVFYMEEVFLLSMLHDHFDAAVPKYGFRLPIIGDKRKKPDKDLRIANTAGYFERGNIFFDEAIKDDRGTKRLIQQYLRFRVGLTNIEKDGPDAVEGGIHLLQNVFRNNGNGISVGIRPTNQKRI